MATPSASSIPIGIPRRQNSLPGISPRISPSTSPSSPFNISSSPCPLSLDKQPSPPPPPTTPDEIITAALQNPINEISESVKNVLRTHPIYAFGDPHGALDLLVRQLYVARLVDKQGHWLPRPERIARNGNPQTVRTIFTGDYIDRGPFSLQTIRYLKALKQEAARHGDNLILLIGNHEFFHLIQDIQLMRKYSFLPKEYFNRPEKLAFREELIDAIRSGMFQLAYAEANTLFTHAGYILPDNPREPLLASPDPHVVADRLNAILLEAVKHNDFSHPIFDIGQPRGGQAPCGGVLWADSLKEQPQSPKPYRQIAGHTVIPPERAERSWITRNDFGMLPEYGGHQGFVCVSPEGQHTVLHSTDQYSNYPLHPFDLSTWNALTSSRPS